MSFGRDYPEDYTTVTIVFTTHDANGAPVAPLTAFEAADVTIYKNGSTAKATTNGVTMTSPLNSKTGLHAVIIDTSNDTGDSGFWTTGGGAVYTVVLDPDTETVNSQTVRKTIGDFSIAVGPVNWGRVSAPTTTVGLTGTTIASTQKVDVDTIKTNPVVNGGTVTFATNTTVANTTGAVGSVTGAVGSVTGLTASNLDATITSRMATYTQPTGFLAATFPGTVASTTNITSATGIDVTKWLGGTIPAVNVTGVPLVDLKYTLGTVSPATAGSVRADAVTGAVGSVTGLTASNLDTTVSSRLASASYTAPPSANSNADALLDRTDGVETGVTPRGLWRLLGAVMAGKVSGAGTGTETFRNTVADSKDRIVATVDTSGNRTAITTDQT